MKKYYSYIICNYLTIDYNKYYNCYIDQFIYGFKINLDTKELEFIYNFSNDFIHIGLKLSKNQVGDLKNILKLKPLYFDYQNSKNEVGYLTVNKMYTIQIKLFCESYMLDFKYDNNCMYLQSDAIHKLTQYVNSILKKEKLWEF